MSEENNRQWVWFSDKFSHLPLPENQFIMSLQNSRAERNRQAAVMMRHKSRLTKLTVLNLKLLSESQTCSLSAWTVPTVIGEVSVGSSSNLYQSFWERDKTHILIGTYLKCGTFLGDYSVTDSCVHQDSSKAVSLGLWMEEMIFNLADSRLFFNDLEVSWLISWPPPEQHEKMHLTLNILKF